MVLTVSMLIGRYVTKINVSNTMLKLSAASLSSQDSNAMNIGDGSGEQWLEDFTTALREELPAGQYLLTHARKLTLHN